MELEIIKFDANEHIIQQDGLTSELPERNEGVKISFNDTANSETLTKIEQSETEDTLSDLQGLMMLIPYYIGIGFLGLPYMVKLLGLWTGLGGLLIYGFLNEVCILILVDCTQRLTERTGERFGDIVRVAEMSMTLGPPWLRPHAGKYKLMVQISLLLNHFLFLADMLSLMTMFAQDLLEGVLEMDSKLTMFLISVLLIPMYLVKNIKLLVNSATIANFMLLGIVVISFQYICRDLPDVSTRVAKPASYLTFTTFANDVMFTLDGASGVLPIRHLMKTTKHFDGWNGVLGVALMFVTCFHAACGFYGYLKFGEMTHVMYLLNLPLNNWLYKSLKILFLLSLYCTTGVVVFVPVDMSWRRLQGRFTSAVIQNYGEYFFRIIILVVVCTFTLLIPEFQLLMSLTGCLWAFFGTVILPASVKIMLSYDESTPVTMAGKLKRKATVILCYILLIFGIYSSISGTVITLYQTTMNIVI